MKQLPRSLDELHGLRAARWVRESTAGQFDAFGPDAQREQQDRAIERYQLVDTGLAWQIAHSGRTVGNTDQFRAMQAAAGVEYDVLVVGYVSRFARDLRTAVNARHDFHAAGAAILFVDERILTSDDERWDEWAREAVEAESYSRKLARRIREGYAAKRRRLGEPGGRPPYGFVRDCRPPRLAADDAGVQRVRAAFSAAARGAADRQVAALAGLPLDTVRGILTNPIYVGRLRDGSKASVEPVVDEATWQRVQQLRAHRSTTSGRPATRRTYALPMLHCAACGRRLIGDSGRYRHLAPCPGFAAARPTTAYRNRLKRTPGHSYAAAVYEDLVPLVLGKAALSVSELAAGASWWNEQQPEPDRLALRRVTAERERALSRYSRDRDVDQLEATMARLDEQERQLREPASNRPEWSQVLELIRDLPALWADPDATAEDRRQLAEGAFERVDALGARRVEFLFTAGVRAVVSVGARGIEPTVTMWRTPSRSDETERRVG